MNRIKLSTEVQDSWTAYSSSDPSRSGHALLSQIVFSPKTKMLSRLSAGAFKKGASLGASRTYSFLPGVRSASVCLSLLLF